MTEKSMVKFGVPGVSKISTYNLKNSKLGGGPRPQDSPLLNSYRSRFEGQLNFIEYTAFSTTAIYNDCPSQKNVISADIFTSQQFSSFFI